MLATYMQRMRNNLEIRIAGERRGAHNNNNNNNNNDDDDDDDDDNDTMMIKMKMVMIIKMLMKMKMMMITPSANEKRGLLKVSLIFCGQLQITHANKVSTKEKRRHLMSNNLAHRCVRYFHESRYVLASPQSESKYKGREKFFRDTTHLTI